MKGIWQKTLKTYQNGKKSCRGKRLVVVVTLSLLLASAGVEAVYAQNIETNGDKLQKITIEKDNREEKNELDMLIGTITDSNNVFQRSGIIDTRVTENKIPGLDISERYKAYILIGHDIKRPNDPNDPNYSEKFYNIIGIGNNIQYSEKKTSNYISIGNNITYATEGYDNPLENEYERHTKDNIAIGHNIEFENKHSAIYNRYALAIGNNVKIEGDYSMAIGYAARSTGKESTAIGGKAEAIGYRQISIGYRAGVGDLSVDFRKYNETITIGSESNVLGSGAMAVGVWSGAFGENAFALGYKTKAYGKSAVAIGGKGEYYDAAKANGDYSIALGASSKTNGKKSIALGFNSEAVGEGAITIGCAGPNGYNSTNGEYSVSIGGSATVKGDYSVALGFGSSANGSINVAIGSNAAANDIGAVSMGPGSKVVEGAGASVAIGKNSIVEKNDIIDEEKLAEWKKDHQKYADFDIEAQDIIIKDSYRGDYNYGVVSVGAKGKERRLINVANGRVGAGSTDAVNGGQLYGAVGYLEGRIDEIKNNMGGNSITVEAGKGIKVEKDGNKYVISSDLEFGGDIGKPIDPTDEPSNSKVNNGKELDIVGGITDKDKLTNNNIGVVAGEDGKLHVQLGKELQNIDSVQVNNKITVGDKVSITESGVSVGDKVNISDGKISVGDVQISDGKVTGLNDGEISASSNDAVNGSQLHATNQKIDNITQDIDNISGRVNKLDGRVNKVGAGAAALAALHPLEFDPEEKLSFSAGMGNYKGETAAALGAFFRPDEKTIISMGGTVGNGENMVNLGISFALDKANKNKAAKVERDAEIEDLRNQVAQLTALVNELVAERNK